MKSINQGILFSVTIAIALLGPIKAGAVTREEMQRLADAYPVGSVVICEALLEGNGKDKKSMLTKTRGQVTARKGDVSQLDVSIMFIPTGSSDATLTVSFKQTTTIKDEGNLVVVDRDSFNVSMPLSPASEPAVTKGFVDRLPAGDDLRPFSRTSITTFPSYVVQSPGESSLYCNKES